MATQLAVEAPVQSEPARQRDFGSSARLIGGFLGRAWLWFVAGCLIVTFVPMIFGWRPYVVESGSMQPRIKVGDVIMASPQHDSAKLLGHVAVFVDPAGKHPGTIKSHRVIKINTDGTLVTKGDANATPDSAPVPMSNVRGMGRLLVRWVGLPLIWLQNGQFVWLGLLLASLIAAAYLVVRDHDEEPAAANGEDNDGDGDDGDDNDGDEPDDYAGFVADKRLGGTDAAYQPVSSGTVPTAPSPEVTSPSATPSSKAPSSAASQFSAEAVKTRIAFNATLLTARRHLNDADHGRHARPSRTARIARWTATRTAIVGVGAGALLLPTTQAAFSATTADTGNVWHAATFFGQSYTAAVQSLSPYLYWKLDDSAGTATSQNSTAADSSGNARTGQYSPSPYGSASWTLQQAGALTDGRTPNYSVSAAGGDSATATCVYTAPGVAAQNPAAVTYSEVIWFKTAPGYSNGGKLIGFESAQTGVSNSGSGGQYDRHIYMDGNGRLWFGVWTGATTTVSSAASYNDGSWHMAVATMGTDGMALYVDGALTGWDPNNASQNYTALNGGWWRVGCGNLSGWGGMWTGANNPGTTQTNYGFSGQLDEATVYTTELTSANVADLWAAASGSTAPAPTGLVNGNFETGSLSPWVCDNGGVVQNGTRHAGTYALQAAGNRKNEQCQQDVTLLPNHTYTLSAYVQGSRLTIGVSGGSAASTSVTTAATWTKLTVSFTTNSTGAVTVYVNNSNATTNAQRLTFYADDFVIS